VRGSEASHTVPAYCLGVLLGLGVLVYTLVCIKRGYLLERDWRGGMVHITRTQQPLFFWPWIIFCLVIGSVVIAACGTAIITQLTAKPL
jgi:hypothetical protein